LKTRKRNRKQNFDYSKNGIYFITSCCKDRVHQFGEIIENRMHLNKYGQIAHKQIIWLEMKYPYVNLHNFVVMPNHIHILLEIAVGTGRDLSAIHKHHEINHHTVGTGRYFERTGRDYERTGRDYEKTGRDYERTGRDYERTGRDYEKTGRDYERTGRDYEKTGRDYERTGRDYERTGRDYERTGRDYERTGRDYEKTGRDYERTGRDYERTGRDLSLRVKSVSSLIGAYKTTSSKLIHLAGNEDFIWQRSFHDHMVTNNRNYKNVFNYITENPRRWDRDVFNSLTNPNFKGN
jgi:REP element-mobilizing transposase RayT